MDLAITGKKALVTGSTAGIGFAIAQALRAEGAHVIVNGRGQDRVDAALAALAASPNPGQGTAEGWAGDLTQDDAVAAFVAAHPGLDILINNIGIYESKPWREASPADFERMFRVNVAGSVALTQAYLDGMLRRDWGRVVFIASESGVNIPPDMIAYGVSKAAQIALARGFAEVTAGSGVTVNSVLPGPTYSEGITRFLDALPLAPGQDRAAVEREFLTRLRPTSLIKRFAKAEEVASLVTYLASPLSAATNGAALRVEGGLLRGTL